MSSPDRGEVLLVDLGYVAKVRPCLVVSILARMQDRALATLVPHTTKPTLVSNTFRQWSPLQRPLPLEYTYSLKSSYDHLVSQ